MKKPIYYTADTPLPDARPKPPSEHDEFGLPLGDALQAFTDPDLTKRIKVCFAEWEAARRPAAPHPAAEAIERALEARAEAFCCRLRYRELEAFRWIGDGEFIEGDWKRFRPDDWDRLFITHRSPITNHLSSGAPFVKSVSYGGSVAAIQPHSGIRGKLFSGRDIRVREVRNARPPRSPEAPASNKGGRPKQDWDVFRAVADEELAKIPEKHPDLSGALWKGMQEWLGSVGKLHGFYDDTDEQRLKKEISKAIERWRERQQPV